MKAEEFILLPENADKGIVEIMEAYKEQQIKELKEYVRHGSYCPTYAGFSIDTCDCGLAELLNKH